MSVITTLEKYKQVYKDFYKLEHELFELRHQGRLNDKILDKYDVSIKDYGFIVFNLTNEGSYDFIPLDDIKEIESITGATLIKLESNQYTFYWIEEENNTED